jgi:hypothetical protein
MVLSISFQPDIGSAIYTYIIKMLGAILQGRGYANERRGESKDAIIRN